MPRGGQPQTAELLYALPSNSLVELLASSHPFYSFVRGGALALLSPDLEVHASTYTCPEPAYQTRAGKLQGDSATGTLYSVSFR